MPLIIKDIKLHLSSDNELSLNEAAADVMGVTTSDIFQLRIVRLSTDARNKSDIFLNYTVETYLEPSLEKRVLKKARPNIEQACARVLRERVQVKALPDAPVVVIGMGPAGLFAAHELASSGIKPVIIERGKPIERRDDDVNAYFSTGKLDLNSNVMFGEGGAGAFSDGKLTTRIKDSRAREVVDMFSRLSGLEEICFMAKPHIGTDRLKKAIANMRKELISMGAEIRFSTLLTDIESRDGRITAIKIENNGVTQRIECSACILAMGQGARDTYFKLCERSVEMMQKPFAVGVRIEHPREFIDMAQYGRLAGDPRLGAAEYALTGRYGERGVYTFCMCPGGRVIASASGEEQVVTNGMSAHDRNAANSNSAIIVQVDGRDYNSDHPLAGMYYQSELEKRAYMAGGNDSCAPSQRVGDFLNKIKPEAFGAVDPSYKPGVVSYDMNALLPEAVTNGIAAGIHEFSRKIKGFDMYDAVLTAVESRSSSPVRIARGETMEATRMRGLYPVGEGAGYAGGIVSAAVDGIKAAEAVVRSL